MSACNMCMKLAAAIKAGETDEEACSGCPYNDDEIMDKVRLERDAALSRAEKAEKDVEVLREALHKIEDYADSMNWLTIRNLSRASLSATAKEDGNG